jgi:hypothetical protein
MRFHDFHLNGYEVLHKGKAIVLHLIYDYPAVEKEESHIKFTNVTLYNFMHTAGAIITDIKEYSITEFIQWHGEDLKEWQRLYGIDLWRDTLENYSLKLQSEGFRVWHIDSAIGFFGFIVAKDIANA